MNAIQTFIATAIVIAAMAFSHASRGHEDQTVSTEEIAFDVTASN